MRKLCMTIAALAALPAAAASDGLVARFNMEVKNGEIVEEISGESFPVEGHFAPENVAGARGAALRFDGYTSHIDASLKNILPADCKQLTFSLWAALPCYPIVRIDTQTSEKVAIASCLDDEAKTGFGFFVGFDGKWQFKAYTGGWPVTVDINTPLPVYQWNNLVAVVDCENHKATVYNNGVAVGSGKCSGTVSFSGGSFKMGRGDLINYSGPFVLTCFNGLIDDVCVYSRALSEGELADCRPENPANLDIPASRFADDILRPRFHGMPAAGWTNECSGMTYSDGRYHLFFQKNADGPFMARLHWGHISSSNLYDWREERIAIAPGDPYDIKGCWSGCVFTDDVLTGGKPGIIYTAVDYAKASIAQASPETEALDIWKKSSRNPIISGRPGGLSDDFRDPYFFRSEDDAYIIVGSSKDGVGTTTLHRYNHVSGNWSNNGDLFFSGKNASQEGRFWEMPNITRMENGKWLFTVTPLETMQGVRTLYWTGEIAPDGKFVPDALSSSPRLVELNSKHGFGLLSPTIYQHEGKTIALGIVPDKLSASANWDLGWAHCYSLPREWSIDSEGNLSQKPFEGLKGMRGPVAFSRSDFELSDRLDMNPVSGRAVELLGLFEVGSAEVGFNIFKGSNSEGRIYYNPSTGEVVADFSNVRRLTNDNGVYDGIYRCPLPKRLKQGETLKLNVFVDHSIIDIFVNDSRATSIRVFPTDTQATGIEAYANGKGKVKLLRGWVLSHSEDSAVIEITGGLTEADLAVDVYNTAGVCIRKNVARSDALAGLPAGLYIVGNSKVLLTD